MKVSKIALACALACTAMSAQAITATNVIYMSGASAQTPGLAKSMVAFCNTTVNTYYDTVDGKTAYAYHCTSAKAISGLTAGTSFILVKSDEGGSFNGVGPVVNQTTLKFPNIASCTSAAPPVGYNANALAGTLAGTCEFATGVNLVPQVGLSDVPTNIWVARGQFTPSTTAYTKKCNFAGQGFGVAVSPLLYTALQNDQIAGGLLAGTCTGVTTAGDCQPSISSEQYANIVAANPGSAYQQSWAALLPNTGTPPAGAVYLERRVATSGTQAASDIYFLNNPCNTLTALGGDLAPIGAGTYDVSGVISTDPSYDGTPAFVVTEHSSTSGVRNALNAGGYKIGVVSLENGQPASGWKWVRLNGVSPNLDTNQKKTTVLGLYDFAFETEMLYRNDAAVAAKNIGNALVSQMGNGANLATFKGLYADPNSGAAYLAGQTHKGSRNNNACQNHQLFY